MPCPCSPVIRQIRQACAEPFEAFEECLRQNEAAVGNCAEHVRRFLQCAEQVQPTHTPSTAEVRQRLSISSHPFIFLAAQSKDLGVSLSPTQTFTMHPASRTSERVPLLPIP